MTAQTIIAEIIQLGANVISQIDFVAGLLYFSCSQRLEIGFEQNGFKNTV